MRIIRICGWGVGPVVLLALVLAGCNGEEAEAWPDQDLRWIVPSSAGGGYDTVTRQLQPSLEEELGVNVPVENLEGGGFAIGTNAAANAAPDCQTIMTHGIPLLQFSHLTQDVEYTYDDFYPVSVLTEEPGLFRVSEDSPYETLQDLVEDARNRPGEVRASAPGINSNNYLAFLQLEDAEDVEFNIVPYDGGSPARNALLSGEVEFTHASVFNSLGIAEDSRVLAVTQDENEWPELTNDAPTWNEELGTGLEPNGSTYGLFVNRECREEYPERYEQLVEATQAATEDEEYRQQLEEIGQLESLIASDVDNEEYHQQNQEETESLQQQIEQNPERFEEATRQ